MLVAYQSDMRKYAPKAQLTAIVHQWGGYYTRVAKAVLDGTWQARPVWGGMKDGFITLGPLNPSVPKEVASFIEAKRRAVVAGSVKPFAGKLLDNQGRQRAVADDRAIATMDWFAQGVSGSVPGR